MASKKRQKYPQEIKETSGVRIKQPLRAKSVTQEFYLESLRESRLTLCTGPAGSGKTFLVTGVALEKLLANEVMKIVITRPVVESGEKLGFLPGTLDDKLHPYLLPIMDAIEDHVGPVKAKLLREEMRIEIAPLAYMRGRTFKNAFVILDEAQNATREQLRMFLTRIGTGSTFAVNGDATQTDLEPKNAGALTDVIDKLRGKNPNINVIEFAYSDIQRDPLIVDILRHLDGPTQGGSVIENKTRVPRKQSTGALTSNPLAAFNCANDANDE